MGATMATAHVATANDALLDLLVEKGIVSRAEASALMEEAAKPASRPIVTSAGTNLSQLRIRGRIQTQFGYTDVRNDNGSGSYSTLEMRRVRLGMQGQLFQNVRARMEANFVPGSGFSMRSAYLQWRENEWGYVKVGFDKPTFGYEENTSSASILTVERSMISNIAAPGAQTGVTLDGKANILSYSAGVYNNRPNTNQAGESGSYLFGISGGLKLDDMLPEGNKLGLRVDLLKNNDQAGQFGFDEGISVSAHYQMKAFDIRAEYIRLNEDDDKVQGWYIMPSYFITDKFQAVVRYEEAKSDDATGIRAASRYARRADGGILGGGAESGDKYRAIYVGGNYYFAGDAHKLMGGVELSRLDTATAGDLKATTVFGAWRMLF